MESHSKADVYVRNPLGILLTNRELEGLQLTLDGLTAREIGRLLRISHRTIETYREAIMTKIGVRTRHKLFAWAGKKGFFDETPPD